MGDLSPHFSRAEFRDRRSGQLVGPDAVLIERLERLRSLIGDRPIRIVSGYRSPASNRAVGGAPRSLHLSGRAADIPQGLARVADALEAGFTGIGHSGGWVVHVDVRDARTPVVFRD